MTAWELKPLAAKAASKAAAAATPAPAPQPSAAPQKGPATPEVDWNDVDSIRAYLRRRCEEMGIWPDHPTVQQVSMGLQPGEYTKGIIEGFLILWSADPTMSRGGQTAYASYLRDSMFGATATATPRQMPATGASPFGGIYGPSPADETMPETHPDTGWQRWPNGVLINPEASSPNYENAVLYPPGSNVPGSPGYIRAALGWDPDKRKEWATRLQEAGYLPGGRDDDEAFATALSNYWRSYYYYGKFVTSSVGGTGAEEEVELGPRDIIAEIRNSVRTNFEQIYGEQPGDYELQMWTKFIVKKARQLQTKFERQGFDVAGAFDMGVGQAEELFWEKMRSDPDAQALENTRLRDSLTEAVYITRGLGS